MPYLGEPEPIMGEQSESRLQTRRLYISFLPSTTPGN